MTLWRFDQGRLDYLQFDEIKRIALALADINGIPKPNVDDDILRQALSNYSLRPFAPANYTVCGATTNVYSVVYCSQLRLRKNRCTDLCKALAINSNEIHIDDCLRGTSPLISITHPQFSMATTAQTHRLSQL